MTQDYTLEPLLREGMSFADAVRTTVEAFDAADLVYAHGTAVASDEAHWLLLDTLGLSPLQSADYTQLLDSASAELGNQRLRRRIQNREPVAYITGRAWFAGHEFICDARALVPRSPLAEFINADFYGLLPQTSSLRVLDLCTGGGSIAIACAHALPDALVDASDLSTDALSLAGENVALHELEPRVKLLHGSLFEPVQQRYDLIISNPPYVDADDMAAIDPEFLHEPAMALAAGEDGLSLVHDILNQSADHLSSSGLLVVEVGNSAPALAAAYPDLPFLWLDFESGGSGVFVLTENELRSCLGR